MTAHPDQAQKRAALDVLTATAYDLGRVAITAVERIDRLERQGLVDEKWAHHARRTIHETLYGLVTPYQTLGWRGPLDPYGSGIAYCCMPRRDGRLGVCASGLPCADHPEMKP